MSSGAYSVEVPTVVVDIACAQGADKPATMNQTPGKEDMDISVQAKKITSTPKVFSLIDDTKAAHLFWNDLAFSVKSGKGRKAILKNVRGHLLPGKLTCILGPSGSGKTSMLNILAGRVRPGGRSSAEIKGSIAVNGREILPSSYQHLFGYVMQDDALFGTMTPREIIRFSAELRLHDVKSDVLDELLADMLSALGLQKCADTMVGNELIKGISGGERKRTAVGAELITNPKITFLDEPTSGLDTAAAYTVVCLLKELTRANQSVLCTIHQPSSEIFHEFDHAIFLCAGEVVYQGPPSKIRDHFGAMGHICGVDYNPADFIMFLVQMADEATNASIAKYWREAQGIMDEIDGMGKAKSLSCTSEFPVSVPRKGFATELYMLSVREFKNTFRDKATLGARFGSTFFMTLIYGLVFFRIGSKDMSESVFVDRPKYDIQSHQGALTMLAIASMFGAAQPLLLTFCSERPVFMRERASNMYGTIPYFLCKTVVEIPLLIVQNILMFLVAYWLMALRGNFALLVTSVTLISIASTSVALLAACLVRDSKQAMEAAPGLFVPQILFAGFFIKMSLIPNFTRWIQYLCSLKWGMNMLLLTEFKDAEELSFFFKDNDIYESDLWLYAIILVGIAVGLRCLAVVALTRKAKAYYN